MLAWWVVGLSVTPPAGPRCVPSTKNLTVPDGVPGAPADGTVVVKVTGWPKVGCVGSEARVIVTRFAGSTLPSRVSISRRRLGRRGRRAVRWRHRVLKRLADHRRNQDGIMAGSSSV